MRRERKRKPHILQDLNRRALSVCRLGERSNYGASRHRSLNLIVDDTSKSLSLDFIVDTALAGNSNGMPQRAGEREIRIDRNVVVRLQGGGTKAAIICAGRGGQSRGVGQSQKIRMAVA
jgi:hypothetical protein